MNPDKSTLFSRERGTLPDKYWYQFNTESAQANYQEQRERLLDALTEDDDISEVNRNAGS